MKKKRPPRHVLEQRIIRNWEKYAPRFPSEIRRRGPKVASRSLSNQRLYWFMGV
jgi:hypothetical protein